MPARPRHQHGTEMRRLVEDLREELERLPLSYRDGQGELVQTGTGYEIRREDGSVMATLRDERLGVYLLKVPNRLPALLAHIGELEREATRRRNESRSDEIIREELRAANQAGLESDEGKKRVREAVAEAEHPSSPEDW